MGLFRKDKTDESVQAYQKGFEDYIVNLNDENELYKAFTEITVLRINLDKNDSIFKNIKDAAERNGVADVKQLSILQFNDVMTTCKSYKEADYDLIKSTMEKILPKNQKDKTWVEKVFSWIQTGLDNMTGKKK